MGACKSSTTRLPHGDRVGYGTPLIPLVLGQSGRAWGSWSPRTPSAPASSLSPRAPESCETVITYVCHEVGKVGIHRPLPSASTGPVLAALLRSGSWGNDLQCSLQPVMVVGVQESRVEPAVALGAAARPRMVKMHCAVLAQEAMWQWQWQVAVLPGPSDQAQSPRMPRNWGVDSHGGMFDYPKSTCCKQDKGRLLKFLPFRRKDITLLRSTASAEKRGKSWKSPVLYLGLKWRISEKVFKKRNLNI